MQARVLVECRGPAREVEVAMQRVSGVASVEIIAGGAQNGPCVVAALKPKDGYDVREEAARTVIQHGWPLFHRRVSLFPTADDAPLGLRRTSQTGAALGGILSDHRVGVDRVARHERVRW